MLYFNKTNKIIIIELESIFFIITLLITFVLSNSNSFAVDQNLAFQSQQNNNNAGDEYKLQGINNTSDFVNTILDIHNHERIAVNVPELMWSDKLADDAKSWADNLVALNHGTPIDEAQLIHSPSSSRLGQGENLVDQGWIGNIFSISIAHLVQLWVDEKNHYTNHPFQWPRDHQYAHYTQMVWWNTTAVGCATATANGSASVNYGSGTGQITYLICRYSPEGNIIGQEPY